ncbi:MAG: heme oxygenase [Rhodospirillaceae bacterium]|nr:heme oxygenase [Rhodospirillaceae bacterium]OUT76106.1 MAG: hypothetical protein CBB83_11235 [Rhodospirillaceae bacterium TMED23]|tara:strand:- start:4650 stop:5438 length:789 start_codon:yes stop_codon:yes gene_type:complete
MNFPIKEIRRHTVRLNNNDLLNGRVIKNINDLKILMENHVFAVWDFMSLVKSLQHFLCRTSNCWLPQDYNSQRSKSARLINEIILSEETDIDMDKINVVSHFDLYCLAMGEIGADVQPIRTWISKLQDKPISTQLDNSLVPKASQKFVKKTFEFISTNKPHILAAAFAFGREKIIPDMFLKLQSELNISKVSCPRLFYYLERHIEVDAEEHGPASLALVEDLCENDPLWISEAKNVAIEAINARIEFWDDITDLINVSYENV